ncbi:chromate transporter [Flavobacterium sp. WLB]|uniref:chromate transporter n=1 Tax=unclassified Flavobacterium TaxID=196869 RepID=UPI0006AB921F|nr:MULTISPECIES: chromate transporter [unclassified Flavobacterium]KOP38048.1 chromate transporter [Flavobacterium sp. VMW]OWU90718.1 chromate transporter [Flavobacterium sp. NLM]PUU68202.1 chromate transporter [Flavobacterium sp. WLB]
MTTSKYSLRELTLYFLKLGTIGFGGPVALVGYMHKDLVENRKWISEEEYKQGLALAQLAPGPLAAQLGIYLGFVHYRLIGATLIGFAFILPSFIMVVLLGIIYKLYGGLPWIQAVFYGVGAAVIGLIVVSSYKLTVKSIGKFNIESFRTNWLLWLFFIITFSITFIMRQEPVLLFIAAGFLYMIIKSPPKWWNSRSITSILFLQVPLWNYESRTLIKIAIFFAEAGTFVFGSGLAIVPFLHSGVVIENHWLTEQQFLDSVAVAMITPGPVVITVGFIGYLVDGFLGALIAALATFLPCYIFTLAMAPYFHKIAGNKSVKSFVDGITAAVIGALAGSVLVIASQTIIDVPTTFIALITIVTLFRIKNLPEPYIIIIAALFGLFIKLI